MLFKQSNRDPRMSVQTYSLPVQKLEASLASQTETPLISFGRPIRPIGFELDQLSRKAGCIILRFVTILISFRFRVSLQSSCWLMDDARCADKTWGEGVDPDIILGQLTCQAATHLQEGAFTYIVRDPTMTRVFLH